MRRRLFTLARATPIVVAILVLLVCAWATWGIWSFQCKPFTAEYGISGSDGELRVGHSTGLPWPPASREGMRSMHSYFKAVDWNWGRHLAVRAGWQDLAIGGATYRNHYAVAVLPAWLVALPAVLVLAVALLRRLRRRRKIRPGHCPKCRYDLTGNTSGICPECGEKIASH